MSKFTKELFQTYIIPKWFLFIVLFVSFGAGYISGWNHGWSAYLVRYLFR